MANAKKVSQLAQKSQAARVSALLTELAVIGARYSDLPNFASLLGDFRKKVESIGRGGKGKTQSGPQRGVVGNGRNFNF